MRIEANNLKEDPNLEHNADSQSAIDEKIDALLVLLAENKFDSETVKQVQDKLNTAIESKKSPHDTIKAFKALDKKGDASREELLDEFSTLLTSNKFDSRTVKKYKISEFFLRLNMMLVGIVMITLGFAMIIMPAPPYFEMFTIYYFSLDDGVTLMDLISLVIVLAGVYVLVRALYKRSN